MQQNQSKIHDFWRWFSNNERQIASLLDRNNSSLIDEIGMRIQLLDKTLIWEIGPGVNEERMLVISPNGYREKLTVTRDIVSASPALEGWEFQCSKPRKQWTKRYIEIVHKGKKFGVDFTDWSYSLVGFSKRKFFDVHLYLPKHCSANLPHSDLLNKLACLCIEGELGEELMIERIDRVIIDHDLTSDELSGVTQITYLYEHLKSVMQ